MGTTELEVEVTIAAAGERRRLWVSALPGLRPGRRLRFEVQGEPQWWRIISVGQIRLREASPALELAL